MSLDGRISIRIVGWTDFNPSYGYSNSCGLPWRLLLRAVEAMKQLDLTPLYNLYLGAGKPPIRPDLMLAIVLIEMRLGRPQPSQWCRDAKENIVIQWAGFGIQPSRTCWYDFADRIAPLLEQWNAEVLQLVRQLGVTPAERASLDGSSVAANASRHRLVNEATVEQRLTELVHNLLVIHRAIPPPKNSEDAMLITEEITT